MSNLRRPAAAVNGSGSRPFADHAAALLASGYSPLPIEPGTKRPAAALHGARAWSNACEAPLANAAIEEFARHRNPYGLGVACGYRGLVALDIDTEDAAIVAAIRAVLPESPVAKRGAKGRTDFYRAPPDAKIAARAFHDADGVVILDLLSDGRQTVIPPTTHPETGAPYAWLGAAALIDTPLAALPECPADLAERLEAALAPWLAKPKAAKPGEPIRPKGAKFGRGERQRYEAWARKALDGETTKLASITAGRNAALYRAACAIGRYVWHGLISEGDATAALLAACETNGYAAKDGRAAARATISSGLNAARNDGLPDLPDRPRGKASGPAKRREEADSPAAPNGGEANGRAPKEAAGSAARREDCPYLATPLGIVWKKPSRSEGEPISIALTNFTARIVRDVMEDDGAETRRAFEIEARISGAQNVALTVPAGGFQGMGWVTEKLGAGAFIAPGYGAKDHARAAIQLLSPKIEESRVYTHTGWREIDGKSVYLHGGGAIGANGPVPGVAVALPENLADYGLPEPPDTDVLCEAIRASLAILDIAPDRIGAPVLGAAWRAPLGEADFSIHLAGESGTRKSCVAALAMQHWGASWNDKHLPGAWASSANSLEADAFAAKDAVFVVDDFVPSGGQNEAARAHREADRLIRAQGNRAGRQRMRADMTLRAAKPPRGLILSTGEDIPRGHSCRARMLIVEIEKGDVDLGRLTAAQAAGRGGRYAETMAGFLRWLAGDYKEARRAFQANALALRDETQRLSAHGRTGDAIAAAMAAWNVFLRFAVECGAISGEEAAAIRGRVLAAFRDLASAQDDHQRAADPVARFHDLLAAALASGRVHVAHPHGGPPSSPQTWGWRMDGVEWRPQGKRIGWLEPDPAGLYLEPTASYAAACEMAKDTGEGFAIQEKTLHKRLAERGMLQSTEKTGGKKRLTVRRTIEGQRRQLLHVLWPSLAEESDPGSQSYENFVLEQSFSVKH